MSDEDVNNETEEIEDLSYLGGEPFDTLIDNAWMTEFFEEVERDYGSATVANAIQALRDLGYTLGEHVEEALTLHLEALNRLKNNTEN